MKKTKDIETNKKIDFEEESHNWFMISTILNKEWVVKETLESRIIADQLQDELSEIRLYELFCRQEGEGEEKKVTNIPKSKIENMYPGYLFIKARMDDKLWYLIRNTKYVVGLLGSSGKRAKPTRVSEWKMARYDLLHKERLENFCNELSQRNSLVAGMLVKVIDGAYKGHFGKIYSSYANQNICFVTLDYFGKRITREIETHHLEVLDT